MFNVIKRLFNKQAKVMNKLDQLMYDMASLEDYREYVTIRVNNK